MGVRSRPRRTSESRTIPQHADTIGRFGIRTAATKKYRIERSEPVYDDKGVPRADFFT